MNTPENYRPLTSEEILQKGDQFRHLTQPWQDLPEDYFGRKAQCIGGIRSFRRLTEEVPDPPDGFETYPKKGKILQRTDVYNRDDVASLFPGGIWETGYRGIGLGWFALRIGSPIHAANFPQQAAEPASVPPVGVAREWWAVIDGPDGITGVGSLHDVQQLQGGLFPVENQIRVREILPESDSSEPHGIEAQVCEDIATRQRTGMAKYGVSVAANPLELRQWLQHLYEELLDASVYLKRAMAENDGKPPVTPPTPAFSWSALWDELPSWINWVAMDCWGDWLGHESKPSCCAQVWETACPFPIPKLHAPPYATNWTTSLVERPGK